MVVFMIWAKYIFITEINTFIQKWNYHFERGVIKMFMESNTMFVNIFLECLLHVMPYSYFVIVIPYIDHIHILYGNYL